MSILALNCGSSSVKYQLYDWDKQEIVSSGVVDRIGLKDSNLIHHYGKQKVEKKAKIADHRVAIKSIMDFLITEAKLISSIKDVEAVGHRVVHGGDKFSSSVLIDDKVLAAIQANCELAPLHNPPNIAGIESARELLKDTPHVAVFDTAFHQTMPEHAYLYGLDYEWAKSLGIRRYGFHGSSHRYIAEQAQKILKKKKLKIISIHVGNGSSLTAIKDGLSVDTSMGMTPLQGVIMGTRCGDIDPALIQYIMHMTGKTAEQVVNDFNKSSGMLGISGVSSDQREIIAGAEQGNVRCKLALDMQAYSIKKYIGAYLAALGGADAIIFTAGIGENSWRFRETVCKDLEHIGIKLDKKKNKDPQAKQKHFISAVGSKVKILVIPTNEEFILARDVIELVRK